MDGKQIILDWEKRHEMAFWGENIQTMEVRVDVSTIRVHYTREMIEELEFFGIDENEVEVMIINALNQELENEQGDAHH